MPGPHSPLGDRLGELLQVENFPPPAGFAARALTSDPVVYEQAAADPAAWWATQARERLHNGRRVPTQPEHSAAPASTGEGRAHRARPQM